MHKKREYWNLRGREKVKKIEGHSRWLAHEERIYKINMDGTFFEAGIGICFVVRNQWEQVEAQATMVEKIP